MASTSHVLLSGPTLCFETEDAHAVFYDDGNRLLLVAASSRVLSYPVDGRGAAAGPPESTDVGVGPVLAARFSLDGRVLALQRSATDLEFIVTGGSPFWQRCKRPGESILGFFWPSSAGVDFVLATTGCLELYTLQPGLGGLRLVEERRRPGVQWMKYTHETRLALLGCGPLGGRLFGFQFSGAGRVKLPKFELPAGDSPVTADSVRLLAVYGRLFCAHVDAEARTLVLYRFYRDALLRQHSFPLPSAAVALSVIDNALVLHTLDLGVALVLDVLSSSLTPLASPLPLGCGLATAGELGEGGAMPGASDLCFLPPDLVLHRAAGRLWRLRLDLRALAASSSDRLMLVGFMQRRREPAALARPPATDSRSPSGPKALTLAVLRTMLQEREALVDLSKVFDILCAACANLSVALSSLPSTPGRAEARAAPSVPACTPEDVLTEIFLPLAEEAGADSRHLRAACVEYVRVAEAAGLPVPPGFHTLLVRSSLLFSFPPTAAHHAPRRWTRSCWTSARTSCPCGPPCSSRRPRCARAPSRRVPSPAPSGWSRRRPPPG